MLASGQLVTWRCSSVYQRRVIASTGVSWLVWCSASCIVPFPGLMFAKMESWVSVSSIQVATMRRFASVMSCASTKLMHVHCEIFCRRLDALCWFVCILSCGVSMLLLAGFGIEIGVATRSVGSTMSCLRASRGSSAIHTLIHTRNIQSQANIPHSLKSEIRPAEWAEIPCKKQ